MRPSVSNSRQLAFPDSLRDEAISLHVCSVADLPAIQEASSDEAPPRRHRTHGMPAPQSPLRTLAFLMKGGASGRLARVMEWTISRGFGGLEW
jgi:hypothetical protein